MDRNRAQTSVDTHRLSKVLQRLKSWTAQAIQQRLLVVVFQQSHDRNKKQAKWALRQWRSCAISTHSRGIQLHLASFYWLRRIFIRWRTSIFHRRQQQEAISETAAAHFRLSCCFGRLRRAFTIITSLGDRCSNFLARRQQRLVSGTFSRIAKALVLSRCASLVTAVVVRSRLRHFFKKLEQICSKRRLFAQQQRTALCFLAKINSTQKSITLRTSWERWLQVTQFFPLRLLINLVKKRVAYFIFA